MNYKPRSRSIFGNLANRAEDRIASSFLPLTKRWNWTASLLEGCPRPMVYDKGTHFRALMEKVPIPKRSLKAEKRLSGARHQVAKVCLSDTAYSFGTSFTPSSISCSYHSRCRYNPFESQLPQKWFRHTKSRPAWIATRSLFAVFASNRTVILLILFCVLADSVRCRSRMGPNKTKQEKMDC